MAWYDRDPRRLQKERELMRGGSRAALRNVGGRLAWVERIVSSATGKQFELVIEYPDRFPYEPPKALVVSPPVDRAPHRLSDGSLCLYADPWHAAGVKTTALAVRSRAVVWCLAFEAWQATGEWLAPQH